MDGEVEEEASNRHITQELGSNDSTLDSNDSHEHESDEDFVTAPVEETIGLSASNDTVSSEDEFVTAPSDSAENVLDDDLGVDMGPNYDNENAGNEPGALPGVPLIEYDLEIDPVEDGPLQAGPDEEDMDNGEALGGNADIADNGQLMWRLIVNQDDDIVLIRNDAEEDSSASDLSGNEDADDDTVTNRDINYDQSAPAAHSYLGEDMQDVSGRVIFDDDSTVLIPAHIQPGVILIPGQTLPIQVYRPSVVAMLRTVVEENKTIAVLHYRPQDDVRDQYYDEDENMNVGMRTIADIGTTAEVLSMSSEAEDEAIGLPSVKAITRGRQRFRLLALNTQNHGMLMARIKILPEVEVGDPLNGAIPRSHYCPRAKAPHLDSDQDKPQTQKLTRVHNRCSNFTHWPHWVYSQYSECSLMARVRDEVKKWGDKSFAAVDSMTSSEQLAYWLADNVPMTDKDKLKILSLHSPIQRLRYELHLIQLYTCLSCKNCNTPITKKSDIFSLSYDGPMGTYVNSYGAVHETLTVYKAKQLSLIGTSSTEYSWFPGYAWTIVNCRVCRSHKGWKFTATSSSLQPGTFFGLTRNGLIPGIRGGDPNDLNESSRRDRRRCIVI